MSETAPRVVSRWKYGHSPRDVIQRLMEEADDVLDIVVVARMKDTSVNVHMSDAWYLTILGLLSFGQGVITQEMSK